MDWIVNTLKSPDLLVFVLTGLTGLLALSIKGAKAKLTEEVIKKIDERFASHEAVEDAHDETVTAKIEALQTDMTEVKADVRTLTTEWREYMRNGAHR